MRVGVSRQDVGVDLMARITDDTYHRRQRRARHHDHLADRLHVDPRAVRELAKRLEVDLKWLDVATGPDVANGTPASYEACLVMGLDPVTGVALATTSEAA